jgi:serine protease
MSLRTGVRGILVAGLGGGVAALAMVASVPQSAGARDRSVVAALAQGRAYRHGVVPMRGRFSASMAPSSGAGDLVYGGGGGGGGVVTGAPRVDLVFWGSQWGSKTTNSRGDVVLSGDPVGMAPDLQQFIKGLGTGGETWSGVMTQYCQGIASGAQTCPIGAAHVGYPTGGGVLAGVWVDGSSAAPAQANGHQLALEAVNAANHFATSGQAVNGNVQYVIVSPPGTHPDGFNTGSAQFCAWHDSSGDSTLSGGAVSSSYGSLPFTNLPYVTDSGTRCGQGLVNSGSAGTLDGVSLVEGHEYAETLTDPYPPSGWTDPSGNENADKCAWIRSGQGASQNITLGTGSFAVQSTWSNDYNGGSGGCEMSHPTVGH